MSSFYHTLRDLARKAYTDDAMRNELLLTTFIERSANSIVRCETRKAKPRVFGDAVSLALEMQPLLNVHGQQPDTSAASVNIFTGPWPSQSELFSNLIFTFSEEIKRVVDKRNGPRNEAAVVNVLPAADRNNRSRTTLRIKISAALGTRTKKNATIAEVTLPMEANRTIP